MAQVMRDQDLEIKLVALEAQRQAVVEAVAIGQDEPAETPEVGCYHRELVARRAAIPPGTGLDERTHLTRTLLLHALQDDDLEAEWHAQRWRLTDALQDGDPDVVNAAVMRSVEIAESLGCPDRLADSYLQAAMVAIAEGRFEDAGELHRRAIDTASNPPTGAVAWQRLRLGWETGRLDLDDVSRALPLLPPSIRMVIDCWSATAGDDPSVGTGTVVRYLGDIAALDLIPRDHGRLAALCMLADAAARCEERSMAEALYGELRPYAGVCAVDGAPAHVWLGSVELYLGMLAAVLGDLAAAGSHLSAARRVHARMGARTFLVRGSWWHGRLALQQGDGAGAVEDLNAALRGADVLGLAPVAKLCRHDLAGHSPLASNRVGARTTRWHLRREGATWRLVTATADRRLRHRKGLGYLHRLVTNPGQELHVLDLAGAAPAPTDNGVGPALDGAAKAAYRRRVEDLRDQIDEGERWRDSERVARAQTELDAIAHEIAAATGLGGRDRPSDAGEKARVSVRKAIRGAVEVIADAAPDVAAHLESTVRTGYYCTYVPDPSSPVSWEPQPA